MDIVINTSRLIQFFNLSPDEMFWVFMANFGWLILAFIFLYGAKEAYLFWLRQQWAKEHKNVLLAIDIPKGNEQSPKAMENMFTYLGGAHGSINFFEKWFEGKFQKAFSFEIVSLEGYTQFLVHTPAEFRNLVESAVYSQYPDAEISEVDDYVNAVPHNVPDEEYDLWGSEFIQASPAAYPIKCYQEFEHQMGPSETQFKDPMASLMDLCGSLRQGENFWLQIIVIPTGFSWIKESEKEINKILGRKEKPKSGLAVKGIEALGEASEIFYPIWTDIEPGLAKDEKGKSMMELTPGEKRKVEGIQIKASKLGFEVKIRAVYIAKKDVMNKAKVANGLVGYMKQFASLDLNNLKPDVDMTFTKTVYFFREPRLIKKKRKILTAYIKRSDNRGRLPGLYNIEELATLWHFPVEANVKAAMVQKAPGRKADAPTSLPIAEEHQPGIPDIFTEIGTTAQAESVSESAASEDLTEKQAAPPDNLPFI